MEVTNSENSTQKKKKILFIADSIKRKTGYATVARNIIGRLVKTNKYDIAMLGLADIPTQLDFPITYYTQIKNHKECCKKGFVIEHRTAEDPTIKYIISDVNNPLHSDQSLCLKGQNEQADNYAYDSVYVVIQHYKPDIVIPINDIWGLYNINYLLNRKCFKFIPYLAIDSECMFPALEIPSSRPGLPKELNTIKTIASCDRVIVFTEWAKKVIDKVFTTIANKTFDKIDVIPHGVDTNIWKPLHESKTDLKKKFFNIDKDIFLIGCVARNQPRKRLDASIMTLKHFIDKYERPNRQAYLYFHCAMIDQVGWPLDWIANHYGVLNRCIFDKRLQPGVGPSDEQLNELINSFDAHLLLTNSEGWCTYPETEILTPTGAKRIDAFEIGDNVITHNGNIKEVLNVLTREYDGEMIRISTVGNINDLVLTPNHNVLVLDNKEEKWIEAKDLKEGNFVSLPSHNGLNNTCHALDMKNYLDMSNKAIEDNKIFPLVKNQFGLTKTINYKYSGLDEFLQLTKEYSRFIGYYIAKGCSDNKRVRLCINNNGDAKIRELAFKLYPDLKQEIYDRNREVLVIYDSLLSEFFKNFGTNAHTKHIPESLFEFFYNENILSKELLNGLFEGDGCFIEKNNTLQYTTVSKVLAEQTRLLLLKNNIYSKVYKAARGEYTVLVQGKTYIDSCSNFIDKCAKWSLDKEIKRTIESHDKIWFKITNIDIENYKGTVYNLSVKDDESYIAEGVAVHNCLPILETAAAGIPNITTNYSAHADWGKGSLMFCKTAEYEHEPKTGFIKAIASTQDAAKQLSLLYNSPALHKEYVQKGIKLGQKLDWDKVVVMWENFLDRLDISDLKEDRYLQEDVLPRKQEDPNDMTLTVFPK